MGDGSGAIYILARTRDWNGTLDLNVLNFLVTLHRALPSNQLFSSPLSLCPLYNVIQPPHFSFRTPPIQFSYNKRYFSSPNLNPILFLIRENSKIAFLRATQGFGEGSGITAEK